MKSPFLIKSITPALILLSLVFFVAAGGAEKKQDKAFAWSMAVQNVRTGDLLPFSSPVQALTGEIFRLVINPGPDCYCYVIAESSGGEELVVLYTGPLKEGETWLSPELILAPPEGSESLFVVASRDEQTALNEKINAFNSNPGSAQRRALLNEVFRIRSEVSKFKEVPEKPISMGGSARGSPGKNEGVEYSGQDTYVKTVSFEH